MLVGCGFCGSLAGAPRQFFSLPRGIRRFGFEKEGLLAVVYLDSLVGGHLFRSSPLACFTVAPTIWTTLMQH